MTTGVIKKDGVVLNWEDVDVDELRQLHGIDVESELWKILEHEIEVERKAERKLNE